VSASNASAIAERFGALGRRLAISDAPAPVASELDEDQLRVLLGLASDSPDPLVAVLRLPGHEPRWAPLPSWLPPHLHAYLARTPGSLYVHQAAVAEHVHRGRHCVLATPTASGKTLAFLVPALARLEADPAATVLALYPTKALAHDQLERLVHLERSLGVALRPAVYDGDTPAAERTRIKEHARIVITNPHGLNLYLGWHEGWDRILANLAVVIVDETHAYTGALGGAVAWLLRRLDRLARSRGARPVFVGASGTIANPAEHFSSLLGAPVELVNDDGSVQPERTLVVLDATRDPARTPLQHAALITRRLVRARRHVLTFSNSRSQAELLARIASDRAVRVEAYRAGYAPERRRSLEREIREGRLRALSATSALELGIDVGAIDTVVLNGFPPSVASLYQRLGRAGRSGQPALGVLVLGTEPASRAIAAAPELLARPNELAIANVAQPSVLRQALELAASERPLEESELATWGEVTMAVAEELRAAGVLRTSPQGLVAVGRRPHRFRPLVELEPTWELRFEGTRTPLAPERLAATQALREAYPSAIVLHGTQPFRVTSVDYQRRVALARPEPDRNHHTQAGWFRAVSLTRTRETRRLGTLQLVLGDAVLTEQVTSAKEFRGTLLVAQRKVSAPAQHTPGEGLVINAGGVIDASEVTALHGVEHLLRKALPAMAIGADEMTSLTLASPTPQLVLFAPDAIGGGTMLRVAAACLGRLGALAASVLERCGCAEGCPFCTLDARCDDEVAPKEDVRRTLERLLAALARDDIDTPGSNHPAPRH